LQVTLTSLLFATGLLLGFGAAVATLGNTADERKTTAKVARIFLLVIMGKV
jgi:hypothetical protein